MMEGFSRSSRSRRTTSAGVPPPSWLIRALCVSPQPAPGLRVPLGQRACAGCCQPRLGGAPSRRSLCVSVPACSAPSPGRSWSAFTRFFLHHLGLPLVRTGSARRKARTALAVRRPFRGCRPCCLCRPTGVLHPDRPPDTASTVWQPDFPSEPLWLFTPHAPDMITVCIGPLRHGDLHPIRNAPVGCPNFGRQLSMLASGIPDKGVGVSDIYRHGLLRKLAGRAFQRHAEQLGNVSLGALQIAE